MSGTIGTRVSCNQEGKKLVAVPNPNAAVLAARARRPGVAAASDVRWEWYIDKVTSKVSMTLTQRMRVATEYLKSCVVKNISTPVVKSRGPRGGRVVTGRSRPGEYPHAETTHLMKTVFSYVRPISRTVVEGFIGTPLDYGLILETKMNRSFLVRTLNEQRGRITKLLVGPIR